MLLLRLGPPSVSDTRGHNGITSEWVRNGPAGNKWPQMDGEFIDEHIKTLLERSVSYAGFHI